MLAARATAKVNYPGTRLLYSNGLLHSDNDEPAIVLSETAKTRNISSNGLFLPIAVSIDRSDAWWQHHALSGLKEYFAYLGAAGEKRWYARGELHRDFGPAVVGCNDDEITVYWAKYARGRLGGDLLNLFDGGSSHASEQFACAPGAVVCSFSTGIAHKTPPGEIYTCVYKTAK
jgi:hypothetical protein